MSAKIENVYHRTPTTSRRTTTTAKASSSSSIVVVVVVVVVACANLLVRWEATHEAVGVSNQYGKSYV